MKYIHYYLLAVAAIIILLFCYIQESIELLELLVWSLTITALFYFVTSRLFPKTHYARFFYCNGYKTFLLVTDEDGNEIGTYETDLWNKDMDPHHQFKCKIVNNKAVLL